MITTKNVNSVHFDFMLNTKNFTKPNTFLNKRMFNYKMSVYCL